MMNKSNKYLLLSLMIAFGTANIFPMNKSNVVLDLTQSLTKRNQRNEEKKKAEEQVHMIDVNESDSTPLISSSETKEKSEQTGYLSSGWNKIASMASNLYAKVRGQTTQASTETKEKGENKKDGKKKDKPLRGNPIMRTIGKINNSSFTSNDGHKKANKFNNAYAEYEFFKNILYNPFPAEVRERSFSILANAESAKKKDWFTNFVTAENTWRDLNLVAGSLDTPGTYLTGLLFDAYANTDLGKAYAAGLVCRPIDDAKELQNRQNIIKAFMDRKDVAEALSEIKTQEKFFTNLWHGAGQPPMPFKDYFQSLGKNSLNKSCLALDIKAFSSRTQNALRELIKIASIGALTAYGVMTMTNQDTPSSLETYANKFVGTSGEAFALGSFVEQPQALGAVMTTAGLYTAASTKMSLQTFHAGLLQNDHLRKWLMHIAHMLKQMKTIRNAIKDTNLAKQLTFFKDLDALFTEMETKGTDLATLMGMLESKTFALTSDDSNSYVFRYGKAVCAWKLLADNLQKFEAPLAAIGEIDAFAACAKLMQNNNNFCFAEFVNQKTPMLELSNCWNPFVQKNAVTNDIKLGQEFETPNMLVTAPNSAGKSMSALKCPAIAVTLAQSFGIAPAQKMKFTPFSCIATYMNISDSQVDQESRFQAELVGVGSYGDKAVKLAKDGKFSFAIFDEIFSGTSPKEGAKLGYKVAQQLSRISTAMSIISTHYVQELAALEKDTNGAFKNYTIKVVVEKDSILRTFKLVPGVSDTYIAEHILKEKAHKNKSAFLMGIIDDPKTNLERKEKIEFNQKV